MLDIVLINPNSKVRTYQSLSTKYSAIETPTWALLLANVIRENKFSVKIIDANAEDLDKNKVYERVRDLNPRFICYVVYGQNVNSGTTNMSGAIESSEYIKSKLDKSVIIYVGSHIQALPIETLERESSIDIGCVNEGIYSILDILKLKDFSPKSLSKIKSIVYRDNKKIIFNEVGKIVEQKDLDAVLSGYAWDLLPYKNKPFDLYRSPLWHAEYDENLRTPYAAIYTSLGCQFKCSFCMINILNRNNQNEIGVASHYSKMRFWSPETIIKQFDYLIDNGVKTIKITDEMFLLNPKFYVPLCEMLKKRNHKDDLRMWAYSRVDTVKPDKLKLIRDAGIKWLCLGIESANKKIRTEVTKGKFEDLNIREIVKIIEENDINVMANYIFGLPGEDEKSMNKTFDYSLDLLTAGWNAYAAMPLPGSELYKIAKEKDKDVPREYDEFSFHSKNSKPLSNQYLEGKDILTFRDKSFKKYFSNQEFQKKILNKFGNKAIDSINEMLQIKLERG